ncbi:hypothetical protein MMC16_007404 [Acarospora aff. strigata]|nr:hypothetical protein [Acarospora aff. strigata]
MIRWLNDTIHKNSPSLKAEAETAIGACYKSERLEARGVTEAIVKGAKHNDPRNPDPKGEHWTVEMKKENGDHVTTKHVYPEEKS